MLRGLPNCARAARVATRFRTYADDTVCSRPWDAGPPTPPPMVSGTHLLAFAATAIVLIAIPGPSVLFVIGRALALGRGPAIASVVGNAFGAYLVAVCVAFGLGSLVQRSELAFVAVKFVGGAYLVWLGIHAIRHRRDLAVVGRHVVDSPAPAGP